MKKYIVFLKLAIQEFFAYRIRIIFSILDNVANPLVLIIAVSGASATNALPNSNLIMYYLGVLIFLPFLWISVEETIGEMTFTGEVNNFLVKPISFYKWMLVREIGKKMATLVIVLPILVGALVLALTNNFLSINLSQLALVFIITFVSFLLCFNVGYSVGLLTFWFDEVFVIRNLREVFVSLLGGVALPYYLFPKEFLAFIFYTPFPYMITWPGRVIRDGLQVNESLIALTWLALSFFTVSFVWGKVVNKYSNVGG